MQDHPERAVAQYEVGVVDHRPARELDLQVSLLVEDEATHILRLVVAMGTKMGIGEADDPEIRHLIRQVEAQEIIDQIEGEIGEAS